MLSITRYEYISLHFLTMVIFSHSLKVDHSSRVHGTCSWAGIIQCCTNYYDANGTCTVCPKGTFGRNCSTRCPHNMYGYLCTERCDCKEYQYCNHVHGCQDRAGLCDYGYDKIICCSGYTPENGNCKACPPGKFGINCSEECPMGRYGLLCVEVCQCSMAECDKALGCLKIGSKPQTTTIIYWIIPVIFAILFFILICICRWFQTNRHRHVVDMSICQPAIHGTGRDEYDQLVDIFKTVNSNTVDKRKFTETSVDANTIETGTSEAEYDNEI